MRKSETGENNLQGFLTAFSETCQVMAGSGVKVQQEVYVVACILSAAETTLVELLP